jgi:hypothetical protein
MKTTTINSLLRFAFMTAFLGALIFSCNKQEEMSMRQPTKKTGQKLNNEIGATSEEPTAQETTADAILSVVTILNTLNQNEFCTARTILFDGEMSDSAKLVALENIGTNGAALANTLNSAMSTLSGVSDFMDLNNNGGNNSFTNEVIDLMLYERDVIWNNAPKKPDCSAYNANVKAIGNTWLVTTAACAGEANLVCIAVASYAALQALAANDASYPDCANGGNQSPLNFWWYLTNEAQSTLCM